MSVTLKLFAYFRENRGETLTFNFEKGMRATDLCQKIKLDPQEVSVLLINGVYTKDNPTLQDGDLVCFFPAVGGG